MSSVGELAHPTTPHKLTEAPVCEGQSQEQCLLLCGQPAQSFFHRIRRVAREAKLLARLHRRQGNSLMHTFVIAMSITIAGAIALYVNDICINTLLCYLLYIA